MGKWWGSQTSILQGCALSMIWINLITTLWCVVVRAAAPGITLNGYVDDRQLRSRVAATVQRALDATLDFYGGRADACPPA